MNLELIRTVWREIVGSQAFVRIPEQNLIMDEVSAVDAFSRVSQSNGMLAAIHAYNLAQSCSVIEPDDTVIDLGCGPATLLLQTAKLNSTAKFIGIDLSSEMIDRGLEQISQEGATNVELRLDDIARLDTIDNESVDVVLSSMALHHLPTIASLEACFASIKRVLRPNGRVYICDLGRLKDLRSIEFLVRRAAIPEDEPIMERDYYFSLQAAFSKTEFNAALLGALDGRARLYSTPFVPSLIFIKSETTTILNRQAKAEVDRIIRELPRGRRLDFVQLRAFLRLSGLRWVT